MEGGLKNSRIGEEAGLVWEVAGQAKEGKGFVIFKEEDPNL